VVSLLRVQARRPPGGGRRQPAAPVLGHDGAQALGGIPVPLYQDAVAAETGFVLQDADVGFAVAEDQEQVDKLLENVLECPKLERIYFDDPRGLRHYGQGS